MWNRNVHIELQRLGLLRINRIKERGVSLQLYNCDPLKTFHWMFELSTEDDYRDDLDEAMALGIAQEFRNTCFRVFGKNISWYHQGQGDNWHLMEFWTHDQSLILELCMKVAQQLNLEIDIGSVSEKDRFSD